MKSSRSIVGLPPSVRRALSKLGADISVARRLRRLPTALMAERAFISRNTLARLERGDPGVSMGIYATVLFVLGMVDRIANLVDPSSDEVGLTLAQEGLPKRVRSSPRPNRGGGDGP
jgi:transcriptional regulator with XRE-family HTH domain